MADDKLWQVAEAIWNQAEPDPNCDKLMLRDIERAMRMAIEETRKGAKVIGSRPYIVYQTDEQLYDCLLARLEASNGQ